MDNYETDLLNRLKSSASKHSKHSHHFNGTLVVMIILSVILVLGTFIMIPSGKLDTEKFAVAGQLIAFIYVPLFLALIIFTVRAKISQNQYDGVKHEVLSGEYQLRIKLDSPIEQLFLTKKSDTENDHNTKVIDLDYIHNKYSNQTTKTEGAAINDLRMELKNMEEALKKADQMGKIIDEEINKGNLDKTSAIAEARSLFGNPWEYRWEE